MVSCPRAEVVTVVVKRTDCMIERLAWCIDLLSQRTRTESAGESQWETFPGAAIIAVSLEMNEVEESEGALLVRATSGY